MSFTLDTKNVQKGLNKLEKSINKATKASTGEVNFPTLFNKNFMKKYTNFPSIDDFLKCSGYDISSQEAFSSIPEVEFSKFINENTKFSSWEDMKTKAGQEYFISNFKL